MKNRIRKYVCVSLLFLLLGTAFPAIAQQQVNINQATLEQLVEVKGIGQKTAEKIIEYRQLHGSFSSLDDLVNVQGIGQKKLEVLRNTLTVSANNKS